MNVPDVEQTVERTVHAVNVPDADVGGSSVTVGATIDRLTGSVGVTSPVERSVEALRNLDLSSSPTADAPSAPSHVDGAPLPVAAPPIAPSSDAVAVLGLPVSTRAPVAGFGPTIDATVAAASDEAASGSVLPSARSLDLVSVGSAPVSAAGQDGNATGGAHGPVDGVVPATGANASASSFAPTFAAALLLVLALVAPRLLRSLKEAPAFLRPAPFIALLERPG